MKRLISIILVTVILLSSCGTKRDIMYLEPNVEVSEYVKSFYDENAKVIGFGFHVNDEVQNIKIKRHRLINGEWQEEFIQYGHVLRDKTGYISLDVDCKTNHMTVGVIITENNKENSRSIGGYGNNDKTLKYKTIVLDDKVNIEYEKDIPLFVQIDTDKEITKTFTLNLNELAKQLTEFKEDVFLITIEFSNYLGIKRRETVNETKQDILEIKIDNSIYTADIECAIDGNYSYEIIQDKMDVEELNVFSQIKNFNKENSTLPEFVEPYVKNTSFKQEDNILNIYLNIGFKTSNQEEIELESDIIMKLEIDLNK